MIVAGRAAQAALAPEIVDAVVERSGGVPFFAEELTRAVLEQNRPNSSHHEIPGTLRDLLMAHLDRLGSTKGACTSCLGNRERVFAEAHASRYANSG